MINIIFILVGVFSGFAIAAAVFALITSIGIVPRLADKTHTAKYVTTYEYAIFLGGGIGNAYIIYSDLLPLRSFYPILSQTLLLMLGIFFGIYIGCLATSLAESLKVTAVFSRRLRLHKGLGFIVLSLALGKCIGSLFYFYNNIFDAIK